MDYMTRIATFGGAACLAVFGITGAVAANHPAPQPAISGARLAGATVRTFNDGFTDAKRDDCQQGFQPACRWLRTVNVAETSSSLPPWFRALTAPRKTARDACGASQRGAVEVWAPRADGFVVCRMPAARGTYRLAVVRP